MSGWLSQVGRRLKPLLEDGGLFRPPHQTGSPADLQEDYALWLNHFAKERLWIFYVIALLSNPIWVALDYLHGDHFSSLLWLRALFNVGWIIGFWRLFYPNSTFELKTLLVVAVLVPNICIAEMTIVLGGFHSQYYNGLTLLLLAGAVIVPVFWKTHLLIHLGTLLSYFAFQVWQHTTVPNWTIPSEIFMFLVWVSICLLVSVILYERLQHSEFQARTSERKARQELEASNQKLLELDRLKSEFFANVSHELRTPLTLIFGTLKSVFGEPLSGQSQTLVETGLRNTSRLMHLINELLDLAKFDSGAAKPQKYCIDLAELLRGVAANFQSSEGRRIHCRGLTTPVPVECDPRHLKKMVYNLLSNAVKFSHPQEGQIWITCSQPDNAVKLEFEDNGIGIPRDQLDRIFDRFTQVEGSATRKYEGTGIGLALVKEIVTLHEGHIRVESTVGEGSTFTVTLPRGSASLDNLVPVEQDGHVDIPPPQEPDQDPTGLVSSPDNLPGEAPLILVADDNTDMRRYLQGILQHHYRLCLAKDGLDALEQAKTCHPELILTDVMMPGMSGYDLLHAIRHEPALATTPVIFLTARAGSEARVESLEAGADDYIQKPFDDQEVLARIGNVIRARRTEKKLGELQKEKLSRFLPSYIDKLVLSDNAEDFLKGHRAEITVLFIDLRGFTAFTESAEPEDIMALLSEYQAEMGRIVTEYQGTLERFTGDGMMVFFNDPLPVANHPQQAVRMALAMKERIQDLQSHWKQRGFDVGAGIGIATGFATIGVIGFEKRQDYTAIGSVTNLAARLCAEAGSGQILVPQRFLDRVSTIIHSEFVGEMTLKGFRNPVTVYAISGHQEPMRVS